MDINEQAKIILRKGKILERLDKETERGFVSKFFIEWQGNEWYISMLNGEVTRLKNLWKAE